ncbi:hypothetical protein AMATHDRAFT_50077 [Amanita thiersii Skay4041]|uniref:Protein kinase domain-containing protein n=1 Tax=Amanita thiersii Skay4041 TaxID=703135 RepID=A0A2A9NJ16_9AGAR|nr:hypothetical protein AMATHDRAFT_50077 [Amanita thiersii Skay4041]
MSFVKFKRSFSDFVKRAKWLTKFSYAVKIKHNRTTKSVDARTTFPATVTVVEVASPEVSTSSKDTEDSLLESLGDAYHAPEILDVHRSSKYGLNNSPKVSLAVVSPPTRVLADAAQSPVVPITPVLEDSVPVKELPLAPIKPLAIVPKNRSPSPAEGLALTLPSPLVIDPAVPKEGSSLSVDVITPPFTPSLTCSTPALSPLFNASISSNTRVMRLGDLRVLQFVSKGSSGQVYLVNDTISLRQFALKVMKKADTVFRHPAIGYMLMEEKRIMASLQGCDWFVQLEASWHDSKNIYLAMAYYPTDIESEIIRCGAMPLERARFYMVEIITALEDLHKRGIVHRDIKAANVLIGWDGHIALADFGLSKDFGRRPTVAERSYQPYWPWKADDDVFKVPRRSPHELTFVSSDFCGSAIEMPPEIIAEECYSFGVDFWSASIVLYMMVTGRQPWTEAEGAKSTELQILEDDITFLPEDDVSNDCKDFLMKMLEKEPTERLRIGLDMTSHPFFAGVDWVAMEKRDVPVPWVPDFISGHYYDEEWASIEEFQPGRALSLKESEEQFPDFHYTSPAIQKCNPDENLDLFKNAYDCGDDSSDFEEEDVVYQVVRPLRIVKNQSPVLSTTESHASASPSESIEVFRSVVSAPRIPQIVPGPHIPAPCIAEIVTGSLDTSGEMEDLMAEVSAAIEEFMADPVLDLIDPVSKSAIECPMPVVECPKLVVEPAIECIEPIVECTKPLVEPVVEFVESNSGPFLEYLEPILASEPMSDPVLEYLEPISATSEASLEYIDPIIDSEPMSMPRTASESIIELTVESIATSTAVGNNTTTNTITKSDAGYQLFESISLSSNTRLTTLKQPIKQESELLLSSSSSPSLCMRVVTWLKGLLPWPKRVNMNISAKYTAAIATAEGDPLTLWQSLKWSVRKLWMPKVKPTTKPQRRRTILF